MSRFCFSGGRKAGVALCLAGAAHLLVLSAAGQEAGLRGAVREAEINNQLLSPEGAAPDSITTGTAGIPSQPYQPISPGALDDDDGSLFSAPGAEPATGADDPFSPLDAPPSRRRPSTAVERERSRAGVEPSQEREPAEQEDEGVDSLSTATTPALAVDATEQAELEFPARLNEPASAIEGLPRRRDDNPYAPLGLRLGTFVVVPTLEQGLTWTSNADNSTDGKEALLSETTLRLSAVSDWPRHRATADAFGTFRKSLSGEEVSEIEGGGNARLELDLSAGLRGSASLGYSVGRESASSPVFVPGVERQPLRHTVEGSLGLERALGLMRLGVTGEVVRNQYGDAKLSGGGTLSQSERNSTLALVRLRGGFELSPALIPFVEIEAGRRIYDEEQDSAGYARSATRLGARTGVALDLSEKLSGEVAAGWISEDFEDARLETIFGIALAANLNWSPQRGTNVNLNATTTVEGTTNSGESGSLLHSGTLRLERQLRSNLSGNVALGVSRRDYAAGGHDLILSGEAALTWWLNRYLGLTGRARHERQTSNLPGREYEATSVFMGMRLQR